MLLNWLGTQIGKGLFHEGRELSLGWIEKGILRVLLKMSNANELESAFPSSEL